MNLSQNVLCIFKRDCMNLLKWILPVGLFSLCLIRAAFSDPYYQEEFIFPEQERHVHSSCIVECSDGSLLACWFRGSGERTAYDVLIQGARLKKGANKWSEPFLMADTPGIPDCNPVLFIDQSEQLWLFWIAVPGDHWEDSILRYRQSKDYLKDGAPVWRWQDILILKPGEAFAETMEAGYQSLGLLDADYGGYAPDPYADLVKAAKSKSNRQKGWMPRTHLNILPSGRILFPLYSDGFYVGLMAISDDGGKTWRAGSPIVGPCLNQPSVVRKKDGTLAAYMRSEGIMQGRAQVSYSSDEGETWTNAEITDIPNPNASLEAIALQDGRWVMAYNDTEEGRYSLMLAISDDEGKSWKWKRRLERQEGGMFHYPSLIQTRNGLLHITYTYQQGANTKRTIKHAALHPDWIVEGQ